MGDQIDRIRLMSVRQVADLLHVSERTVMRRIKEGELTAHMVGHQWRLKPADVETYLARHRKSSDRLFL